MDYCVECERITSDVPCESCGRPSCSKCGSCPSCELDWCTDDDLPGFAAHAQAGVEAIREASKPRRDYGHDVAAFNADHNRIGGCQMARTAGGDTTECDTHHAYVSHGVPIILRDAV